MAKTAKTKEVKMNDVQPVTFEQKVKELEKTFRKKRDGHLTIPTGSISLDQALAGGYQTGRIYEFIAWEGVGKTTLALHAIAEAQKMGLNVCYIDAEHAIDETYAKAIGVDWEALQPTLFQPDNGEEGINYARELMSTKELGLCIFDSVSGLIPQKQMEDPAGTSAMGLHSKLMGMELPKLATSATNSNCCVIFINQVREKIGVIFGSPETTQGGNALRFWASVRIELRRTLVKEEKIVVSSVSRFKTIKNKISTPYQEGEIPITFGVGIDKMKELKHLAKWYELISQRGNTITIAEDEAKYSEEDFDQILEDNVEFRNALKEQIIEKMNE